MMNWNIIKTQADADALMRTFMGFHDSCIREAHLWTDLWVSEDSNMHLAVPTDNKLRLLFQRQWKNPSAIELLFEKVIRFNMVPAPDNNDPIIYDATLIAWDGEIFWADDCSCTPDNPNRDRYTWISAKKLSWHPVDWLGPQLHYGPGDVEVPDSHGCARSGHVSSIKEE